MIRIKRVYERASGDDGCRILVDGLWPRGLSKEKAKVDLWLKDLGVSRDLRKWFSHDPAKWTEFKRRFFRELSFRQDTVAVILEKERTEGTVTLLYGSREEKFNNAAALRQYLASKTKKKPKK